MLNPARYLVTSALPYANGPLHIGHLAGAYLASDAYVRFLRLMDKDVVHVCGSDEYGVANTLKAKNLGITPQELVDKNHALIKSSFESLRVDFDIYHRTTEAIHAETAQGFFRTLHEKGEFIKKTNEQYYDEEANQFLADRYIMGTCPNCGNEEAYGDQCEKCGRTLSPEELINPRSTLSGSKPVLKATTHWYLALDKNEPWLKEWINTGKLDGEELHDPSDWKNHVIGQCNSWIDSGLQPRSMTRDLDWGVDVPQEIDGSEGKKLYVWLDAPIGYISATKQWALDNRKDWEPYWKDRETMMVHFIGKDNIVFHCLIFPTILKTHGGYNLPVNVPANQFMNLEGRKLSTSKGWAVWVHEYLEDFPGKEDVLRYHLVKNMPEQRDSEFTWKGYQESNNNELVANFANFVNRVLVLTHKYYEGKVPDFDADESFKGVHDAFGFTYHDSELLGLFDHVHSFCQHIRAFEFREGLKKVMELSSWGNQLLQYNEPWKTHKEDPEMVKAVMNLSIQYVAVLGTLCRVFMPNTSDKIYEMLNLKAIKDQGDLLDQLDKLAEGELLVPAGHQLGPAQHLFNRIDDSTIQAQLEKLNQSSQDSEDIELPDLKDPISFDQFGAMDLRVGQILTAEKMPKANKLLKLEVDIGVEKRTIVSGIAKDFDPEELPGKKVVVLANLTPKKLRGVESNGMILLAEDEEGRLDFVVPESSSQPGHVVK